MNININAYFGSYLKAQDCKSFGGAMNLQIHRVEVESLENDGVVEEKVCLKFTGWNKALMLNKTNATTLMSAFGETSDGWIGQIIQLSADTCLFKGAVVDCIRVSVQPPQLVAPNSVIDEKGASLNTGGIPQQTVPQQAATQQTVVQPAVPQQVAPQQVAPQQVVPQQAVTQPAVPQQAAPQQVVPQPITDTNVAPQPVDSNVQQIQPVEIVSQQEIAEDITRRPFGPDGIPF